MRSDRSLIQTIGRAARHLNGMAIMYADKVTDSMQRAIDETDRRREKQTLFNVANGIVPRSIVKDVREMIDGGYDATAERQDRKAAADAAEYEVMSEKQVPGRSRSLKTDVRQPRTWNLKKLPGFAISWRIEGTSLRGGGPQTSWRWFLRRKLRRGLIEKGT